MWRLIHNTGSLFYRVFKEKYFPNCSIFEANSSSSSFAWKSILQPKKLIERGASLRVSDGKSIRIFHDAWLLNEDGRITSPWTHLAPEASVNLLINQDTSWWNTHLIDLCFYPPEANHIKISSTVLYTSTWHPDLAKGEIR